MKYKFRKGDIVRFKKGIKDESLLKIKKFVRKTVGEGYFEQYVIPSIEKLNNNKIVYFEVSRSNKTNKTGTEYCKIYLLNDETKEKIVYLYIQARFLKMVHRKPGHPLTSIFI